MNSRTLPTIFHKLWPTTRGNSSPPWRNENAPVGSQSTSTWTEDGMAVRTMQRCLLKWCKLITRNYQYFQSCSVLKHNVFQCWGPPQSMPYLSRKNKSKSRKDLRQQWVEQDKAGLLMSSLIYYFFFLKLEVRKASKSHECQVKMVPILEQRNLSYFLHLFHHLQNKQKSHKDTQKTDGSREN